MSVEDGPLGIPTPMSFTRFVSSIYKLAPDNPFNLPIPFHRRFYCGERRPAEPVLRLEDRPLDEAITLMLFYQFLR